MQLRPYQQEAVDAVYRYLRQRHDNPCVVIPTGGGKTPLMATICGDAVTRWNGRVLILAHVKELLEQTAGTLRRMAPDLDVGVYSAGLKRRDTDHPVIVAGIQSVYKRACELDRFDLIVVDECHLLSPDGDGMYQTFLADAKIVNPQVRLIGLTATPYRLKSGMLCGPENLLNEICYEVGVKELIAQGYLCPLRTKAGQRKVDTSALHVRAGEFVGSEVEALMDTDELVGAACREIIQLTAEGGAVLIFAASVAHAEHVKTTLERLTGEECGLVTGNTPAAERDQLIARFKGKRLETNLFGDTAPPLKYLVNVNVLTTGFDAPNVDCVVLLRPTASPGLFYQMCLDMETEVLTENGWAKCEGVKRGDRVAAFDMDTGRIEWCRATNKVHRSLAPGEQMYGVESPHLDIRVTDRHTMVYQGRSRSCKHWRTREARHLARFKDSYYIPIAGNNDGPGISISDDELRLIGWVLTDGYVNPHNAALSIAQAVTSPHNDDIRAMLDGCGFGYRVYRHKRQGELAKYADGLTYVVPFGEPRGVNKGKRGWEHLAEYFLTPLRVSLRNISQRQLGVMLSAMNLGDGCKPKKISWTRRTISLCLGEYRHFADELQAILIQRGYRCNIAVQQRATEWCPNPKPQHILHIRRQDKATIGGTNCRANNIIKARSKLQPVTFDPTEKVWCLTTQCGTLVTRRNGKVAILGNCGRGFRLHPSKRDCLVLDYGGNILRHGPVDAIQVTQREADSRRGGPAKECPECRAVIHAGYAACPDCGFQFPPPEGGKHETQASDEGILTGQVIDTEYDVTDVIYTVHTKRGADEGAPKTMRVDYRLGLSDFQSEWVCPEHDGWARQRFEQWWRQRSNDPLPSTAQHAVDIANAGGVANTHKITVRKVTGEKFDRVVDYQLGEKPEPLPADVLLGYDDDDIPF